jgi:hypothetical protein
VGQLPFELLRYTLPSRYCDSDKLLNFAWNQFGQTTHGLPRVQAICDWVHNNIEYRFGSGRPDLSASEVIARRHGVCRDFAHAAIALCRAFNLPARYVTGHLPDIGYVDPGTPMDFHAYCEVYLGQEWLTFDPRYNVPRIGRVKVAHGADAVDGAFATIYGEANLTHFEVWAYQVNPQQVSVGDPIDLSKRLGFYPSWRALTLALAGCSTRPQAAEPQLHNPTPALQTRTPIPSNCKSPCASSSPRGIAARPSGWPPSCTWANRIITTRCNIFSTPKRSSFTKASILRPTRIMFTMPTALPPLPRPRAANRRQRRLLDAIHARPFPRLGLSTGSD